MVSIVVATIAATEAIASDIIDSTLAHVDDRNETDAVNSVTLVNMTTHDPSNTIQFSSSSDNSVSRDMLDEIEETFNITNPSSINTSFRPTSQINDFFSSTLDEFRNLTLNNIVDDSSDENDDEDTAHNNFAENSVTSNKK
ncbi:uncharacterized protein LOC116348481 [Contarinia nasturtii]|uniref:uncharacterized protein LOC116348481 n=1 Tax=Contarinia nasturtii TaxID=265458 RepID=UPI0012D441FD|nr:uncharacterized protein LOC116348481 [Contarinia nasturtii]